MVVHLLTAILYNEIAKRLFSQLDHLETAQHVNIVIDRSKNKDEIVITNFYLAFLFLWLYQFVIRR